MNASQFSPTMWTPGVERRSSDLATCAFAQGAIFPALGRSSLPIQPV